MGFAGKAPRHTPQATREAQPSSLGQRADDRDERRADGRGASLDDRPAVLTPRSVGEAIDASPQTAVLRATSAAIQNSPRVTAQLFRVVKKHGDYDEVEFSRSELNPDDSKWVPDAYTYEEISSSQTARRYERRKGSAVEESDDSADEADDALEIPTAEEVPDDDFDDFIEPYFEDGVHHLQPGRLQKALAAALAGNDPSGLYMQVVHDLDRVPAESSDYHYDSLLISHVSLAEIEARKTR